MSLINFLFLPMLLLSTPAIESKHIEIISEVKQDTQNSAAAHSMSVSDKLSAAIRIKTISNEKEPLDPQTFLRFKHFLKQAFPLTHQALKLETFDDYSLRFKWQGQTSDAPLVLMAHQDVVPVPQATLKDWHHPPFSGFNDGQYIWGRGSLDAKNILISVLQAIEEEIQAGFKPQKTIYIALGHDEEILGSGAKLMAKDFQDRAYPPGLVLDEGLAITHNMMPGLATPLALIGVSEKGYLTVELISLSPGGHSSMPPTQTAISKLARALTTIIDNPFEARLSLPIQNLLDNVSEYVDFPMSLIFKYHSLTKSILINKFGQTTSTNALIRTTIAPTIFHAGIKANVLPTFASAKLNFRILPGDTIDSIIASLKETLQGHDIEIRAALKNATNPSPISCIDCPEYTLIKRSLKKIFPNAIVASSIVVGATDARHYSALSPAVYRFSPFNFQPEDLSRIHGTNERVSIEDLTEAVKFYREVIQNYSELATSKKSFELFQN